MAIFMCKRKNLAEGWAQLVGDSLSRVGLVNVGLERMSAVEQKESVRGGEK